MRKLILLSALLSSLAVAQDKKRVAVMNFEYGTVSTSVMQIFGTNQDIGKGIADMLVDRLVNDGKYSVIERKALDKLISEQNFSNSDRADPSSAARIGKLLGVDAIIVGSITEFGRDDKSKSIGGIGGAAGKFGIGGIGTKEAKAVVQITARLVNVETGEILASIAGKGESKRSGANLIGGGGGSGGGGVGGASMSSSNFGATIIGEATNAAVTECATGLDDKAAALAST
jgi:curli biogenesis system outer membrane secretion channel CsgG